MSSILSKFSHARKKPTERERERERERELRRKRKDTTSG